MKDTVGESVRETLNGLIEEIVRNPGVLQTVRDLVLPTDPHTAQQGQVRSETTQTGENKPVSRWGARLWAWLGATLLSKWRLVNSLMGSAWLYGKLL